MKRLLLRIPSDFALIFLGALSSVLCFTTAFEISVGVSTLALAAAVCAAICAPLFASRRVNGLICLMLIIAASVAYFYYNRADIVEQSVCVLYKALHMGAVALGRGTPALPANIISGWESADCTELFILAIIVASALIAWSMIREKSFPLAFASTMLFLAAPLFLTITPDWLALMGLVLFWTAALISHVQCGSFDARAPIPLILPLSAALIAALMVAYPEEDYARPPELDELRNELTKGSDINLNTMVFNGFGSSSPGRTEFKNVGDWHTNGTIMLRITDKSGANNYYRGNTGAVYTGTGFKEISASSYRALKNRLEGGMMTLYGFEADSFNEVTIEYVNADKRVLYAPYYLMTDVYETEGLSPRDDVAINKDRGIGKISLDVLPYKDARASRNDSADMAAYYEFVLENYINVPSNLELKLRSAMSEYGIEYGSGIDEAVRAVRGYLERTAVYTTTPGNLARGADFVEYFLFENKRGYCIHFATSGVMLLRSLGVPARYADGYIVRSSDFNSNGVADIPDRQAHAWAEVFYEGIGWVPVELTPGAGLEMDESIFDAEPEQEPNSISTPPPVQTSAPAPTPVPPPEQEAQPERGTNSASSDAGAIGRVWRIALAAMVLCAYIILRVVIKHLRKKAFSQENTNARTIAMYLYIQKLARGRGLPVKLKELAEKAQFSQHTIDEDELAYICGFMYEYRKRAMSERPIYERVWLLIRVL